MSDSGTPIRDPSPTREDHADAVVQRALTGVFKSFSTFRDSPQPEEHDSDTTTATPNHTSSRKPNLHALLETATPPHSFGALESRTNSLREELADAGAKLVSLEKQLSDAKEVNQKAVQLMVEAKADKEETALENNHLNELVSRLTTDLSAEQETSDVLRQQLGALSRVRDDLDKTLSLKNATIVEMTSQRDQRAMRTEKDSHELQIAERRIAELVAQVKSLHLRSAEQEEKWIEREQKNLEVKDKTRLLQSTVDSQLKKLEEMKGKLTAATDRARDAEIEAATLRTERFDSANTRVESEAEDRLQQSKMSDLIDRLAEAKMRKVSAEETSKRHQEENTELRVTIDALQRKLLTTQQSRDQLDSRVRSIFEGKEQLGSMPGDEKKLLAIAHVDRENLQNRCKDLSREMSELTKRLEEAHRATTTLSQRAILAETEKTSSEKRSADAKQASSQAQARVNVADKEVRDAEDSAFKAKEEWLQMKDKMDVSKRSQKELQEEVARCHHMIVEVQHAEQMATYRALVAERQASRADDERNTHRRLATEARKHSEDCTARCLQMERDTNEMVLRSSHAEERAGYAESRQLELQAERDHYQEAAAASHIEVNQLFHRSVAAERLANIAERARAEAESKVSKAERVHLLAAARQNEAERVITEAKLRTAAAEKRANNATVEMTQLNEECSRQELELMESSSSCNVLRKLVKEGQLLAEALDAKSQSFESQLLQSGIKLHGIQTRHGLHSTTSSTAPATAAGATTALPPTSPPHIVHSGASPSASSFNPSFGGPLVMSDDSSFATNSVGTINTGGGFSSSDQALVVPTQHEHQHQESLSVKSLRIQVDRLQEAATTAEQRREDAEERIKPLEATVKHITGKLQQAQMRSQEAEAERDQAKSAARWQLHAAHSDNVVSNDFSTLDIAQVAARSSIEVIEAKTFSALWAMRSRMSEAELAIAFDRLQTSSRLSEQFDIETEALGNAQRDLHLIELQLAEQTSRVQQVNKVAHLIAEKFANMQSSIGEVAASPDCIPRIAGLLRIVLKTHVAPEVPDFSHTPTPTTSSVTPEESKLATPIHLRTPLPQHGAGATGRGKSPIPLADSLSRSLGGLNRESDMEALLEEATATSTSLSAEVKALKAQLQEAVRKQQDGEYKALETAEQVLNEQRKMVSIQQELEAKEQKSIADHHQAISELRETKEVELERATARFQLELNESHDRLRYTMEVHKFYAANFYGPLASRLARAGASGTVGRVSLAASPPFRQPSPLPVPSFQPTVQEVPPPPSRLTHTAGTQTFEPSSPQLISTASQASSVIPSLLPTTSPVSVGSGRAPARNYRDASVGTVDTFTAAVSSPSASPAIEQLELVPASALTERKECGLSILAEASLAFATQFAEAAAVKNQLMAKALRQETFRMGDQMASLKSQLQEMTRAATATKDRLTVSQRVATDATRAERRAVDDLNVVKRELSELKAINISTSKSVPPPPPLVPTAVAMITSSSFSNASPKVSPLTDDDGAAPDRSMSISAEHIESLKLEVSNLKRLLEEETKASKQAQQEIVNNKESQAILMKRLADQGAILKQQLQQAATSTPTPAPAPATSLSPGAASSTPPLTYSLPPTATSISSHPVVSTANTMLLDNPGIASSPPSVATVLGQGTGRQRATTFAGTSSLLTVGNQARPSSPLTPRRKAAFDERSPLSPGLQHLGTQLTVGSKPVGNLERMARIRGSTSTVVPGPPTPPEQQSSSFNILSTSHIRSRGESVASNASSASNGSVPNISFGHTLLPGDAKTIGTQTLGVFDVASTMALSPVRLSDSTFGYHDTSLEYSEHIETSHLASDASVLAHQLTNVAETVHQGVKARQWALKTLQEGELAVAAQEGCSTLAEFRDLLIRRKGFMDRREMEHQERRLREEMYEKSNEERMVALARQERLSRFQVETFAQQVKDMERLSLKLIAERRGYQRIVVKYEKECMAKADRASTVVLASSGCQTLVTGAQMLRQRTGWLGFMFGSGVSVAPSDAAAGTSPPDGLPSTPLKGPLKNGSLGNSFDSIVLTPEKPDQSYHLLSPELKLAVTQWTKVFVFIIIPMLSFVWLALREMQ